MRIAFIVGTFPQLSETFVLDQLTGLIDRGHEVVIFGRAPTEAVTMHAELQEYDLLSRTRHWVRGVHTPFDALKRTFHALRAAPGKATRVWLESLNPIEHGWMGPSGLLWAYASTAMQEAPFDVVLAHFGNNGLVANTLRQLGALDAPLVTIFHGHDISEKAKTHGEHYYDALFAEGELMLPVSHYFARRLVALGCSEDKVRVQRMGVDTHKFELRERTPATDGKVELLSVCRLVEKKGIEMGLRGLAEVEGKTPVDYVWRIVGDGPLRESLEALAKDLGIAHRVRFEGPKTRSQVLEQLERAHVFVAPSVTAKDGNQEGVPVAIMEAAACGVPVLSTRHSGIPELVADGESGFLVDEWDLAAFAERAIALMEHPERWPAMGRRGREIVEREFDVQRLNDALEAQLERVARRSA